LFGTPFGLETGGFCGKSMHLENISKKSKFFSFL
jgi:hypothetical protein